MATQKIAILGGGMAGLTAAYALTDTPEARSRYEITVYQQGWRLGGKGASGRNRREHDRIEEHGIHIFLGFYHNAFRVLRRCYDELNRPLNHPLSRCLEGPDPAFRPQDSATLLEREQGHWRGRNLVFPRTPLLPGESALALSPRQLLVALIDWIRRQIEALMDELPLSGFVLSQIVQCADELMSEGKRTRTSEGPDWPQLERTVLAPLCEQLLATGRPLTMLVRLAIVVARGLIRDQVPLQGFDSLDNEELTHWLRRHGAREDDLQGSVMRGLYLLPFAFEPDDLTQRNLAAGAGLRGILRMFLTYRGAFLWKMQAGMGDVVFAPLYEVLRRRGVHFEFFHRVEHLGLSADQRQVERIRVARQLRLQGGSYDPLVDVGGLPCWPSSPLDNQIDPADVARLHALEASGLTLESAWANWQDVESRTLQRGTDFDQVVLAIPIAALPFLAGELIAARPAWRNMVDRLATIQTQQVQLWLRPNLPGLGWQQTQGDPVAVSYERPFDSWIGMTHLLSRESWAGAPIGHLAYLCSPIADAPPIPAPHTDPTFPPSQLARVTQHANAFLQNQASDLWPNAAGGVPPNWVVSRYDRVNVNPSDRYVLSQAGATQYRLPPEASGFDNLVLAGDWTRNGLNTACIEATTISGLQAARGLGAPVGEIPGETDVLEI